MELKRSYGGQMTHQKELLIVPYGIETSLSDFI